MESVLANGFMPGDPRFFDLITRPANGSKGWGPVWKPCLDLDEVASCVLDLHRIIAIPHRYHTRLCVVDLDNHGDGPPVWTRDSPRLLALARTAEAHRVGVEIVPSPHGIHVWLELPVALPIVRAHWLVRRLLDLAGLDHPPSEIAPSLRSGTDEANPKHRTRSKHIRLPGQPGTVIPGDPWTDPFTIWRSIEDGLRIAAASAEDPAWRELVKEAAGLEREHERGRAALVAFNRRPARPAPAAVIAARLAAIQWTAPGQSNALLGALANIGWAAGHRTVEALGAFIEAAAREAHGFATFASADTKRRLSRWSAEWAACCVAHPPVAAGSRPRSADPGRNARLSREAFCAVLAAAERAAREHGEAALSWSARKVAEWSGVARTTLARLRFHWRLRLLALLYRRRSEHPAAVAATPTSKGGSTNAGIGNNPGRSPSESINLLPLPARSPRSLARNLSPPPPAGVDHPLPTLPAPIAPHRWQAAQRAREREELAAWLGAAAA